MCAHTAADAAAARARIATILQPQIDAISQDKSTLNNLSNFYHCESEKFKIMASFAGECFINGNPIDKNDCTNYSAKLSECHDVLEGYADYLDILKAAVEKQMSAEEAIVAAGNTDCWACMEAALLNSKYKTW